MKVKINIVYLPIFLIVVVLFLYITNTPIRYAEGFSTLIWYLPSIIRTLSLPGGLSDFIGQAIIQFGALPYIASIIIALLICSVSLLHQSLSQRILSAICSLFLFTPLLVNTYTNFSIIPSFAVFIAALAIYRKYDNAVLCIILPIASWWMTGAAGIVLTTIIAIDLIINRRWIVMLLLLTSVTATSLTASLILNYNLWQIVSPAMYYNLHLNAPISTYIPWSIMVVSSIASYFYKTKFKYIFNIIITSSCIVWGTIATINGSSNNLFKELCILLRENKYDDIIRIVNNNPNNFLYLNCRSAALGATGQLRSHLLDVPCHDFRAIFFMNGDKNPQIQMLQSETFLHMGHASMARNMAFQAGESCNNISPWALKNLITANWQLGTNRIAEKYCHILKQTLFYKDFADCMLDSIHNHKPQFINCLADNRFAGEFGIDNDVRHFVFHNPDNHKLADYLWAIETLSGQELSSEYTPPCTDTAPASVVNKMSEFDNSRPYIIPPSMRELFNDSSNYEVSTDDIDPYIIYRLIEPGYETWHEMGIYCRDISSFEETTVISNRNHNYNCVNCHNLCNFDPDNMLIHVRKDYGGTYIREKGDVRKLDTSDISKHNPNLKGFTYPSWHPDGRFIAFSSNQTLQRFHTFDPNIIEVMDYSSDIVVYDTQTNKVLRSPLISGTSAMETFPCFSPDGKSLYFCSADSVSMPEEFDKVHYSLCRIDFNETTSSFGNKVDTIYSAGSISFPRVSPDGNWLLFTKADYGNFSIWHRDADLYLMNLNNGSVRAMDEWNSNDVESYHSWSSNGRWVVFSSKRMDGLYTRLFIAHFDENGVGSKPFILPQNEADYYNMQMKSYNIPEFSKKRVASFNVR